MIINGDYDLIEDIIEYYIFTKNNDKIINYSWLALINGNTNIAPKFLDYLIECNTKIENIFEVYVICCGNIEYSEIKLDKLKKQINLTYQQIEKFYGKRFLKIHELINKYVKCYDVCNLICDY
jgi:hypothetical protein